jgi:hypothetical protein
MQMENDWIQMFQVEQVEPPKLKTCGCASGSCKAAKKFRCECHCKHAFHGINAKSQLADLRTKLFGEPIEDPVAQTFSPEEYQEEMAILA